MAESQNKTAMDADTRAAVTAHGTDAMREINDRIRSVLEEAPSDSSAELSVRRTRDGYKGFLKIYSQQRKFVGGGHASKFSEVIERLFREVHEQIGDWKRDRFATAGGLGD